MEKQKWHTIEEEDHIAVLPDTDIRPHAAISLEKSEELKKVEGSEVEAADMNCPCKPRVDWSGRKPIVIHNSFQEGLSTKEVK